MRLKSEKSILLIMALSFIFSFSCSRKDVKETTFEPSIERTLENLAETKSGKALVKYLNKNPARLQYNEDKTVDCLLYDFGNGTIKIPRKFKESDLYLELSVLKAIYVWKVHNKFNLEDRMMEEDTLADLEAVRFFIGLGVKNSVLRSDPFLRDYLKKKLCSYLLVNTQTLENIDKAELLTTDPKCGRPMQTLSTQRGWLVKLRDSLNTDTFFDLMYENDMRKVKRGAMTQADATRNDAMRRSRPLYEIYRTQRSYQDITTEKVDKFEKYYKEEVKYDAEWRDTHKEDLDTARYEFLSCVE